MSSGTTKIDNKCFWLRNSKGIMQNKSKREKLGRVDIIIGSPVAPLLGSGLVFELLETVVTSPRGPCLDIALHHRRLLPLRLCLPPNPKKWLVASDWLMWRYTSLPPRLRFGLTVKGCPRAPWDRLKLQFPMHWWSASFPAPSLAFPTSGN